MWFKKEEAPPELKDLSAEQIVEKLKKADSLEVEVKTIKDGLAAKETELTGLKTQFEDVKTKLETIEAGGGAKQEDDNKPKPLTDFLVDQDRAFAERAAPLAMVAFRNAASNARTSAGRQLEEAASTPEGVARYKLWKRYGAKIDEAMKTVPLDQQMYPETWVNAFDMIVGRNLAELTAEIRKSEGAFFSEGGGAPPPAGGGSGGNNDKLTPEELKVAAGMHITPEKYLESKKKFHFVS